LNIIQEAKIMGFMDRLNNILKSEEEYDENEEFETYEEDEEEVSAPAPVAPVKTAPVSRPTGGISSNALEMKVVKPERFDEVSTIGEHLLARRTVVLNLEETNKETTRRIIDFLGGVVFAIEGQVKKVANATYVVTPKNVDVSGEQAEAPVEEEQNKSRELFR
jgi:cell division inhibitor SepF